MSYFCAPDVDEGNTLFYKDLVIVSHINLSNVVSLAGQNDNDKLKTTSKNAD